MDVYREQLTVKSNGGRPTFHLISDQVREIVRRSGIRNGICVIYTHHTTCSIVIQECSFDVDESGLEYMQHDLVNILEHIAPTFDEGVYKHPGPQAVKFAASHGENRREANNTEAHIRSSIFGRSETVVIADGSLDLGAFGQVYFVDFDQTRARERQIQVQIIGI